MAAVGQLQLAPGVVARLLAGHRHQSTRQAAPVQHGGGTLEDVDPLEEIGIHLQGAVGSAVAQQFLAIQVEVVHRAIGNAAHGHIVVAAGSTIGRAHQAGRVTQRLGHALRALVVHLFARDHRDALGGFQQRHAGLGRHAAVAGLVPFGLAEGIAQGAGDIG